MSAPSSRGFASSVLWKLLERSSFALVQFVVQIALARMLAPDDFGLLAVILAFVNFGVVIVQSGLNTALVQGPDIDELDYSIVFWMCLGIAMLLFVVVLFVAPFVSRALGLLDLVDPLRAMASILIVNAFTCIGTARLMREMRFRAIFATSAVSVLFSGVAGIACAFAGLGIWALVVQQISYQVVLGCSYVVVLRWVPTLAFDRARASSLFSYGWKVMASSLLDTAYQGLFDVVVGKQFGSATLGMVSQGRRWPQAVAYLIDGSVQPVALSAYSKAQADAGEVKRMMERTLCTYVYIAFPAMTMLGVCAEPIVALLLGEKWLPCVPFLQMYCILYALLPLHTVNLQAINAVGKSGLSLKLEVVKKACCIVLLALAAFVVQDVYWVGASAVLGGVIAAMVSLAPGRRLFGYSRGDQLRGIAPALLLSAACGIVSYAVCFLDLGYAPRLVVQVALVLLPYGCISALLGMKGFGYLAESAASLLGKPKRERG